MRLVPPLHRRLPHRRARRARDARRHSLPVLLDADRERRARALPRGARAQASTAATSARTSAPGTAAWRSAARASPLPVDAEANVSLVDWLERDARRAARTTTAAVRAPEGRALPEAKRARGAREHRAPGGPSHAPSAISTDDDPLLREYAEWACERLDERAEEPDEPAQSCWRPSAGSPGCGSERSPSRSSRSFVLGDAYPSRRYEVVALGDHRAASASARSCFLWLSRRDLSRPGAAPGSGSAALVFDAAVVAAYVLIYSFDSGTPIRQARRSSRSWRRRFATASSAASCCRSRSLPCTRASRPQLGPFRPARSTSTTSSSRSALA